MVMSVEKKSRNEKIRSLHIKNGGKLSYRQIQKMYNFKSVRTPYDIVNRPYN